jgi:hypothetical protein
MLLSFFLTGLLLLPANFATAYAIIDLNAISVDTTVAVEKVDREEEVELVEKVEVSHKQTGMFLALVPITFTVKATVWPDGTVELSYPWYSALTVDHQAEFEAKVKVAVDNALKQRLVGSVRAEGKPALPRFTPEEVVIVKAAIAAALNSSLTPEDEVGSNEEN